MRGSLAWVVVVFSVSAWAAQEGVEPEAAASARCLKTDQIDNSFVIDTTHIVFEMRGHDIYVNTLPACKGLGRTDMLTFSGGRAFQLCSSDRVTVVRTVGEGYMPGPSCALGKFEKVTKEQVEMLRGAKPAS